jgi:alpha-N-arabinofuranosidase
MSRVLVSVLLLWGLAAATAAEFKVVVKDQTLHAVDKRLFGQFLERASWGEPGPEAFADSVTGQLPQQRNIAV